VKLKVISGEREEDLVLKLEAGRVLAEIGNRVYSLDVRETEPHSFQFFLNTNVHECRVSVRAGSKDTFDVSIHGHSYEVSIVDPKRLRSGQNSDRHHHGVAEIVAPMPGKVVRVLVAPGDGVEAGDTLVVVEAMKMENELVAPIDGVVVQVGPAPPITLEKGALIVKLAPG